MKIEMKISLDHDGFLRRECPHCVRQFKWHHGPANEEAEQAPAPTAYHCPLCGRPAAVDAWLTREQVEYGKNLLATVATREIKQQLGDSIKTVNSKYLKIEVKFDADELPALAPLTEPDDMVIVTSPCHSYEPVKVPEDETGPFHCLVCGEAFAV